MYDKYYTELRSKIQEKRSGGTKATAESQVAESEARRALGQRQVETQKERFRAKTEDLQMASADDSMMGWMETIYDAWAPEEAAPAKDTPTLLGTTGQSSVDYSQWAGPQGSLIDMIDKKEGGGDYDTLFSHSQKEGGAFAGVKVSTMTIGELKDFTSGQYADWSKGKLGYVATPMGRYQFVGTTMAAVAKEMGLPDDTMFSPKVQDAMFAHLAKKVGPTGLKSTWEGFKGIPQSVLTKAWQEQFGVQPKKRPLVTKKGI